MGISYEVKLLLPKLSDMVDLMVTSLVEFPKKYPDVFRLDMSTFGAARKDTCYGCAATCCLYELSGKAPNIEDPQPDIPGYSSKARDQIESLVNFIRCAQVEVPLVAYGLPLSEAREIHLHWHGYLEYIDNDVIQEGRLEEALEGYKKFSNFLRSKEL